MTLDLKQMIDGFYSMSTHVGHFMPNKENHVTHNRSMPLTYENALYLHGFSFKIFHERYILHFGNPLYM